MSSRPVRVFIGVLGICACLPAQDHPGSQIPSPSLRPASDPIRCLTPGREPTQLPWDHPDCDANQTNPAVMYAPTFVYRIPVVVHVIQNTSGQGNLSDPLVRSQIDILNEDFRALPGTRGSGGTDTKIEFFLATTDPNGAPTTGIVRHTNNTWFADGGGYYNAIAWNTQRYLNIYTNNVGNGLVLGYVPSLPQTGLVLNSSADRVVILYSAFGRNALGGTPYNQGRTATHEVGHYLGLYHTFEGGCGVSSQCYATGDLICDTASEANPRYGCPTAASSCSSTDPVRNYMDYTDDLCMTHFTPEQARRLRCTIQHYRPQLAIVGNCSSATADSRNAGTNPLVYSAQPPRVGQPWAGSVVLFGSGFQLAGLYGFVNPAQTPVGNGLYLLMDLSSPQVFNLPFNGNGIVATFSFTVPPAVGLCGLPISTQALLFGGPSTFSLSNAMDLMVGL